MFCLCNYLLGVFALVGFGQMALTKTGQFLSTHPRRLLFPAEIQQGFVIGATFTDNQLSFWMNDFLLHLVALNHWFDAWYLFAIRWIRHNPISSKGLCVKLNRDCLSQCQMKLLQVVTHLKLAKTRSHPLVVPAFSVAGNSLFCPVIPQRP